MASSLLFRWRSKGLENFSYIRFKPEFFEQHSPSNLAHRYGFRFDYSEGKSGRGIDFSKVLLFNDYQSYIDPKRPIVSSKQHTILKRDHHAIIHKFRKYIAEYCDAYRSTDEKWKSRVCTFSTLQNFHQELGLID